MALEDEDLLNVYGKMSLHGMADKGAQGRIAVNKSLGRVLSKLCLDNSSDKAVDNRVRSHVEALLASPLEDINPYRHQLQGFHDKPEQLKHFGSLTMT
ncbi:hypothetical protein N7454_002801 [Penicillium verhagenii]|nr:hypothetical protein N7454_002801 [Penicillium verhagenii]